MLNGIFHVSFTVSDIEQSKDFYGRIIGLELVHEMHHDHPYTSKQTGFQNADLLAVAFRIPGVEPASSTHVLELVQYRNPRGSHLDTRTNNVGAAHLAFTVDDIDYEYSRLREQGVVFRSPPVLIEAGANRGGYTVYFQDPDMITLELVQRPRVAPATAH